MPAQEADQLKTELLHAIKHDQLVLYYQPQFNLATTRFEAFEALVRWRHPSKGLLLPAQFLSVAETSGLIVLLGDWVLKTACLQNKAWQDEGFAPVRVAVNVSGRQFKQKDFVETVMKALTKARLKPKYLELELTENIILQNEDVMIHQIQRLKALGVSIALDDFGMGYSSITHLKTIPVDRIKIDKSFIRHMRDNKSDAAIVRALITLAAGLNLQVLAEGVESLQELQLLLEEECNEIQGFYYAEPLPVDEVRNFLQIHSSQP